MDKLKTSDQKKTVILVEDSLEVMRVTEKILARAGYDVLTANNTNDAIKICKTVGKSIDIGVIDAVIPTTNGPDLAMKMRRIFPKIKILFMTGYSDADLERLDIALSASSCLYKPFKPNQLLRRIKKIDQAS